MIDEECHQPAPEPRPLAASGPSESADRIIEQLEQELEGFELKMAKAETEDSKHDFLYSKRKSVAFAPSNLDISQFRKKRKS